MRMCTPMRSTIAACALVVMSACTTPAAGGSKGGPVIEDGQAFAMHPGEAVTLADNSALRYLRVVNDSRCPPGVQCIWAGDAEVAFEWKPASAAVSAFSLHTGKEPKQQVLGERTLVLVSLARGDAPEAQLRIEHAP